MMIGEEDGGSGWDCCGEVWTSVVDVVTVGAGTGAAERTGTGTETGIEDGLGGGGGGG